MIVSIHQPSYFPWLGLLHKIAKSDVHIIMDEVQLSDSAYQHRNLFLAADGKVKYLTIPFRKKGYIGQPIRDLVISDPKWARDHLNFITNSYRKHPHFREVFPAVEAFYSEPRERLLDAIVGSMRLTLEFFEIEAKLVFQSEFPYDRSWARGDLVVGLVRLSGADCYLSGTGAKAYLDETAFAEGPALTYDDFTHRAYSQKNSLEFVPGLSSLDVLFNLGKERARELLLSCGKS